MTKSVVKNKVFWTELRGLFGKAKPENAAVLGYPNAVHFLLEEVQFLTEQILSWAPKDVETRKADCRIVHQVYAALGMTSNRLTVAVHFFLMHYQEASLGHGNLIGPSAEGGEHSHQPHKGIVWRRPPFPHGKCPQGLYCCMQYEALGFAFWGEKWSGLLNWNKYHVQLPKDEGGVFCRQFGSVRKSHCHVFLGGPDPGQAPLKTLLLMLRLT